MPRAIGEQPVRRFEANLAVSVIVQFRQHIDRRAGRHNVGLRGSLARALHQQIKGKGLGIAGFQSLAGL